jgi:hypothetical protein
MKLKISFMSAAKLVESSVGVLGAIFTPEPPLRKALI